ncbi:hypothetical protein H5T58_03160 [Candidatus Parcubacteria bacterium]|nr:hypothetical protein [Candidatus Parcubacteria bacterium]
MLKKILIFFNILAFTLLFFQINFFAQNQIKLKTIPFQIHKLSFEIKDLEVLVAQSTSLEHLSEYSKDFRALQASEVKFIQPKAGVAVK